MSQTPIPQLPYDIIDNIITKMKMMEAKEMVADLPKYKKYKNITYFYILENLNKGNKCDTLNVKYTLIKRRVVEIARMRYLDRILCRQFA